VNARLLTVVGTMLAMLFLGSVVRGLGQRGDGTEWQIVPRWTRGQELIYHGTIREQSAGGGVQFNNAWKLEARAFVLDMHNVDAQVAFLTRLTAQRPTSADKRDPQSDAALRLDIADVDGLGRIAAPQAAVPAMAVDGPTAWEWGFVVPSPPGAIAIGKSWNVQEPGQPLCKYRLDGEEIIGSTTCLRVIMDQQSDDWSQPRADSTAWRRRDTLWVMPRLGIAYRVKREVQRREPAHRDPTYLLVTEYDMDSSLEYKGNFFEERRREVLEIKQLEEARRALVAQQQNAKAFEALLARIDLYMQKTSPTPFRDALLRVRDRVAANQRGERETPEAPSLITPRLTVGRPAPDFVIQDFDRQNTLPLRAWRGKPLLMVFYQPGGGTASLVLRFAQHLADLHQDLRVVGFSTNDDVVTLRRVSSELSLTFPTLPGKSLLQSYEVVATPRIVLLDADGVVRGKHLGWGPEVAPTLEEELKKIHAPAQPK